MKFFIKNKKFTYFYLASIIATITSGMTAFSMGIYVFELTESPFIKSMITLLAFLPTMLLGPLAGLLADRYDRRKLMILGDSLSIIGLGLILYGIKGPVDTILFIGLGTFISSVFTSLIEPASKVTVSDILNKEDFIKANGLLQLSSAGRFIISPILAVLVMTNWGVDKIIYIDALSLVTTISALVYISKGLEVKKRSIHTSYTKQFREALDSIKDSSGLSSLIVLSIFMTYIIGSIEELSTPLILSFRDEKDLSIFLTIAAFGMVVTSLYLGLKDIGNKKVKILSNTILVAAIAITGFGFSQSHILMTIFGFVIFSTLPIFSSIFDYFVRVNIDNEKQGRVFGLIGTLSQFGYLIAYGTSGFLAEYVFNPLLNETGVLSPSIGKLVGVGPARGIGLYMIMLGTFLLIIYYFVKNSENISSLQDEKYKKIKK